MKINQIIKSMGLVALCFAAVACNSTNEPEKETTNEPIVKSGEFSISATQKVKFAPGNLQYQASTKTFRFAPKQYEVIGELNENISDTYDGWIDLFGWGTGTNPILHVTNKEDENYNARYRTFTEWGTNKIGNDTANTWRTLKQAEWNYILFVRPNANQLFAGATVNSVKGFIILPDNWTTPASVTFIPSADKGMKLEGDSATNWRYANDSRNNYTHNTYTAEEWTVLEDAGAIFFPVCNLRWGSEYHDNNVGCYWCADLDEANCWSNSYVAYWMNFSALELACRNYCDVAMGNAVRLAQDI